MTEKTDALFLSHLVCIHITANDSYFRKSYRTDALNASLQKAKIQKYLTAVLQLILSSYVQHEMPILQGSNIYSSNL